MDNQFIIKKFATFNGLLVYFAHARGERHNSIKTILQKKRF